MKKSECITKYGHDAWTRILESKRKWRENNPERMRQCRITWKLLNREKNNKTRQRLRENRKKPKPPPLTPEQIKLRNKGYQLKRIDKNRENARKYRLNNLAEHNARLARWRLMNKEHIRLYDMHRRHNNLQVMVKRRLSSRINSALRRRNIVKDAKTSDLIGCTWLDLKIYFESKFVSGMGWHNRNLWHVDHIKPCASFDLSSLEEQRKCFHFTNLQPLWWYDNLSKGDKITI